MNFENVTKANLMLFDELIQDPESSEIIDVLDTATSDAEIKQGMIDGVNRLIVLGKISQAEEIKRLAKGFAF